jgi:predicted DNA-binding transcriptional regulator YafY
MSHREPFTLTSEQQAAIRVAAASIQPCWRDRFLASVQDQLLSHEPDRVTDADVARAIDGVRWAMTVGLVDPHDEW